MCAQAWVMNKLSSIIPKITDPVLHMYPAYPVLSREVLLTDLFKPFCTRTEQNELNFLIWKYILYGWYVRY